MKTLIFGITAGLFTLGIQAQNKNVTDVSKTTVTTVKDSEGEKKLVKRENVQEVQNIEFQNAESDALNKDVKPSPVAVTSSTEVTLPDGTTRTVDVDRSAYYSLGENRYRVALDNAGYTVSDPTGKRAAILRKTSNNSYIFRSKDKTSIGYFDTSGNLVLETYDDKSDKVTVETYRRNP
ncbi:MAG TPA: hypothetical protein VGB50_11055 [Flavobacterium sp.]|jgi:hypothetical protein